MSSDFARQFMGLALEIAHSTQQADEVPVGAIIVHRPTKEVLASAGNRVLRDMDPTGHAEIVALRMAASKRGDVRLTDCDLYVTLEPCPMCAQAISFARIRTLYFGAYDPKGGGVEHGPQLYRHTSCFHIPQVVGGILEKECGVLLKSFFSAKRGV